MINVITNERDRPIERTTDVINKVFTLEFDEVESKFLKILAEYERRDDQGVFIFADELIVN